MDEADVLGGAVVAPDVTRGPWQTQLQDRPFDPQQVPVVRLLDYPVQIGVQLDTCTQALLWEISLMALDCRSRGTAPPQPVVIYQELMNQHLAEISAWGRQQRQLAQEQGKDRLDMEYPTNPQAYAIITYVWRCIDRLNHYAKTGQLLSVEMPPLPQALFDWVREEFFRQLEGQPPTPWPGPWRMEG